MFYNLNFIFTNRCNSKCKNCNIWKLNNRKDLSLQEIENLFGIREFRDVTELGISGGEPFIRSDINQCFEIILKKLKKLSVVYITTNGTFPEKVIEFCELASKNNLKLNIGVSLDGDKETNKTIRGIDTYDNAVNLLKRLVTNFPQFSSSVSLTICQENCNERNLNHIVNLCKEIGCGLTFRIADTADNYYHNEHISNDLSSTQMELVIRLIEKYKKNDLFLQEALDFYKTGKSKVMYDYKREIPKCGAGKDFAFIQSDGEIFPCIYSTYAIGKKDCLFIDRLKKYYKISKCPCMTECTVWPTIIKNMKSEK